MGAHWGAVVAARWQRTVQTTFAAVKAEAERRQAAALQALTAFSLSTAIHDAPDTKSALSGHGCS